MDEHLELVLMHYTIDTICDRFDINQLAVLKLLIEEGLVDYDDLLDDEDNTDG